MENKIYNLMRQMTTEELESYEKNIMIQSLQTSREELLRLQARTFQNALNLNFEKQYQKSTPGLKWIKLS